MPTPRKHANHAARQAAYRHRLAEASKSPPGLGGPVLSAAPRPGPSRWRALLRQTMLLLETVEREMEECYEQRSDKWQESEPGELFLERLETVREAQALLEQVRG